VLISVITGLYSFTLGGIVEWNLLKFCGLLWWLGAVGMIFINPDYRAVLLSPFLSSAIFSRDSFSAPKCANTGYKMTSENPVHLDPVIHSQVRLSILSILAAVKEADFNTLKKMTGTTDGNLSTHLSKLEEAGYVKVKKSFKGKKPLTSCSITAKGKEAFSEYLKDLEKIIHFSN